MIEFRPIDLASDAATCVLFRRDSYVCSFSDPGRFDKENGVDGQLYLNWLRARMAEFPQGFVHVWKNGQIAGQIEMRPRGEPPVGYVNLFYLVPALRGSGAGELLNEYAVGVFRGRGIGKLRLSVSPSNGRAVAFYRKLGWDDLGPRSDHPEVHLMELNLSKM